MQPTVLDTYEKQTILGTQIRQSVLLLLCFSSVAHPHANRGQTFKKNWKKKLHVCSEIDQKLFFYKNSALQAACDTSIARVTGGV